MSPTTIVTSGNTFIDIDGFACVIAYTELLKLLGQNSIAVMSAKTNSSVPKQYRAWGEYEVDSSKLNQYSDKNYIVLDLSEPEFFDDCVEDDKVIRILDHHPGFEEYWKAKIGDAAVIESIGAAATLVVREYKEHGLLHKISPQSAELLAAAILSNSLIFQMKMTTQEDKDAYKELQKYFAYSDKFEEKYFAEVEKNIEEDVAGSLMLDSKFININGIRVFIAQLELFSPEDLLSHSENAVRKYLAGIDATNVFVNLAGLRDKRNIILFRDLESLQYLQKTFPEFVYDEKELRAVTPHLMLRKELLKGLLGR